MKKLFYITAFILIAISFFFNVSAHAAGGAGGSWDNDSGFGGNGGSTGGGGAGGSWSDQCSYSIRGRSFDSLDAVEFEHCKLRSDSLSIFNLSHSDGVISFSCSVSADAHPDGNYGGTYVCEEPPSCPVGQVWNGTSCVTELKCPAGYSKDGDACIWQCPAGYKMLGGNCVKDDMPEDCDPTIQECDENGEPVCDCCGSLQQLVNLTNTQINNDNRIISLTENIVTTMNTTNNNINNVNTSINNVNNNISNVNNNLTTINESIENIITTIQDNKPDFDTSAIEAKLQQLIDKDWTVDVANIELDLTELLLKLDELNQSIIDNKYDDTELKEKIDELINKDLSEITDRQDEQTSLLEDIKRLLLPTNEAGDPDLNLPEVEQSEFDPWAAIKGFDISNNIINASRQCPADKSFTVMGATFSIPMTPMCTYLGYLAPIFLALAYFQGAMIILRSGD
ncbi:MULTISPECIES: virulence factor TspB C-terminal domain-related protein [unclassified Psychrobacter]|uniref:virulence factor TspB C-terminal domain-related protein n=1 Tax=unclassified Psychrobacter TaxID=196806 RepID=UPI0025B49183|nr:MULTISPECIES: virulence factor TspB C-terminal domain-related protein [unclassified Psychrobacter]MDN3452259.1 virulence factor TspB C-terminal domain-related protein [Psychrobacter sp. APC 3350]MDN3502124.1 virulence factor TspB C-terminal domain-related protein [Psychrobacter sp. 5A.1]